MLKRDEVMPRKSEHLRIFSGFEEYWHYIRCLSSNQKKILFESLSSKERELLSRSVTTGGWEQVCYRDILNQILDDIKEEYGIDLLEARFRVLSGKSSYLPREVWEEAVLRIHEHDPDEEHTRFIFGGLVAKVCDANPDMVCLLRLGDEE